MRGFGGPALERVRYVRHGQTRDTKPKVGLIAYAFVGLPPAIFSFAL